MKIEKKEDILSVVYDYWQLKNENSDYRMAYVACLEILERLDVSEKDWDTYRKRREIEEW